MRVWTREVGLGFTDTKGESLFFGCLPRSFAVLNLMRIGLPLTDHVIST